MRALPVVAAGLSIGLTATVGAMTALASGRQASFARQAAALEHRWGADTAAGEPAAGLQPLRSQLARSAYESAPGWSPQWWVGTGQSLLDDLEARTSRAWTTAVDAAREQATPVFTSWELMAAQLAQFIPASAVSAERGWAQELAAAATPAAVERLIKLWTADVSSARKAALLNQLNAEVSAYRGLDGLLAQADAAVAKGRHDHLDTGQVPALTTILRSEMSTHTDATTTMRALLTAVQTLHALIGLNNGVAALLPSMRYSVDQAGAERIPNAASFLAQYNAIALAFRAASETSPLNTVAAHAVALRTAVAAGLTAGRCGHSVPSGKVITLNLTLQEAIFYQNGCVVRATPITTGRPYLRTPIGDFHVFFKTSPFTMVSPWPPGSPFWYPTGTVTWVMEFDYGGYFLHDASWEPSSMYGPGSENSYVASHGCVHIPTPVMRWAYGWTPIGTPVIITQ
ncbi:MAG TPA: L,D-transpeptidase [Candidatus Dormibacteraeota bacterium]|jgi:lipoprotein-anchoring transpeptidase ErfK/SrfK